MVDYTSDKLPSLIHSALQDLLNKENAPSPDSVAEVLRNTISRFDESIGQALRDLFPDESVLANMTDAQIRNIINDGGPNYTTVRRCTRGTTVLVALVDPSKSNLWVASLGDCVASKLQRYSFVELVADIRFLVLGSKKADQWTATVMSTAHNGEAKEEAKRVIREHPNEPDVMLDNRVLGSIAVTRGMLGLSWVFLSF